MNSFWNCSAGNPTPNTGNLVDDITASIANNNMPEAVSAIARSFKADDLDAIEMAVQNVSRVGLAENAIKALVAAAKEEAIDGDAAVKALAGPIMSLPPANATIYSGTLFLQILTGVALFYLRHIQSTNE